MAKLCDDQPEHSLLLKWSRSSSDAMGSKPKPRSSSPPGRLIDIGGLQLHVLSMGKGSPTVLFESGGGQTTDAWRLVQPEVARFTRACSYDRAGLGWSEPSPEPRNSQAIVKELRALLTGAEIEGPYVLVAHSVAGLNVRLFAAQHPEEVVGMVLIDSIHEDHYLRIPPLMGQKAHDDMVRLQSTPEAMNIPEDILESIRQVRAAPSIPHIPLAVISGGRGDLAALGSPWDQLEKIWTEHQTKLAQLVPGARHIVDEKSGHQPHLENPQLVVETVREIVEAARRSGC